MARTIYVAVAFMMATVVAQGCCPNSDGVSGYEFSHNFFLSSSILQNGVETNIDCGVTCNAHSGCVGFSFGTDGDCHVYTQLGPVVNGHYSEAYTKCQAGTVTGMCSGNSITTEDVDCSPGDGTTAANTQNKGSTFQGTTDDVCCEAPSSPPPLLSAIGIVDLGTAGDFVLLTKAGVTTTGVTNVGGDMGTSPIAATAMTGFTLILHASTTYSTSALVTGNVYAASYTQPTPTKMTQAISDMETAYTDAAGRVTPDCEELGAGNINRMSLRGGLYKWSTSVTFSEVLYFDAGVNPETVWILQIAQNLVLSNGAEVKLLNGAKASNIFWQVAGETKIPTGAHAQGIILGKTTIIFGSGSKLTGRGLAQTAVTMIATTIVAP